MTQSNMKANKIGEVQPDGTVLAGISPDTGKPLYALPSDTRPSKTMLSASWFLAMDTAKQFEGYGHPKGTFRFPTEGGLGILFENSAKIGGFTTSSP